MQNKFFDHLFVQKCRNGRTLSICEHVDGADLVSCCVFRYARVRKYFMNFMLDVSLYIYLLHMNLWSLAI